MRTLIRWWTLSVVLIHWCPSFAESRKLESRDSLNPAAAATDDIRDCLRELTWTPQSFEISIEPAGERDPWQAVLRFPSPVATGDSVNDRVAVLWYKAQGVAPSARVPAIVVVHESGSSMPVGKAFASLFAAQKVHAFLVQLPHYGLRRTGRQKPTGEQFLLAMRQAIADVRRTRDAVSALDEVDSTRISLQGTSLGGFVAATTAGIDRAFDHVFIMVAGGDLLSMLERGQREAAELRERLQAAGYTGDRLKELLWTVEPTRLAGRLDSSRTWLYSAEQDQVVPIANALALKQAASLADDHHIRLPGDHVSTIVFVPAILTHVMKQVQSAPP
jgi:hypothetical protein